MPVFDKQLWVNWGSIRDILWICEGMLGYNLRIAYERVSLGSIRDVGASWVRILGVYHYKIRVLRKDWF